jgi:hypothetical protein
MAGFSDMKDHALRTMFSRGAPHPWEYQAGLQLTASVAEPDHREVVTSSVVDSVRNELNLEISYSGDRNRLFNVDAFVTQRREKQSDLSLALTVSYVLAKDYVLFDTAKVPRNGRSGARNSRLESRQAFLC